jgi:uncharacterized protein YifN (PemK superfamily)
MAIRYEPPRGAILLCDYSGGMMPEMTKKRPVIVLSTPSAQLCMVVPLSSKMPVPIEPWHYLLSTPNPLPSPYDHLEHWVKADMVSSVSYRRLSLLCAGKDKQGKRIHVSRKATSADMTQILTCINAALSIRP